MKILRLAMAVAMVSVVAFALAQAAKAEPFKLKGEPKPAWLYFDVKSDGGFRLARQRKGLSRQMVLGVPGARRQDRLLGRL